MENHTCHHLTPDFLHQQEETLKVKLARFMDLASTPQKGFMAQYIDFKKRWSMPMIKQALSRIENGTYGICITCGEEIPIKRLQAVPGACRCTNCQEGCNNEFRYQ
jgi:RNA polymerase-binding transcription factor DksA